MVTQMQVQLNGIYLVELYAKQSGAELLPCCSFSKRAAKTSKKRVLNDLIVRQ